MTSVSDGPVPESERADVLDALRGFALLGILISHIPDFSGHSFMSSLEQARLDHLGLDGPAALVQDFLIRGKFYSLFSLLFGIGFSIQLESASRRGADFGCHFARRLTVLLGIGLLHAFVWYGDILKDYALIGFLLIPLKRWKAPAIASAAIAVLALRLVWPLLVAGLVSRMSPGGSDPDPGASFSTLTQAFGGRNIPSLLLANLDLLKLKALQMVYDGKAISVLAMFLLGALVGRLGLHRDLASHRRLFRNLFLACLPIGLIGNVVLTPLHAVVPDFPPTSLWVAEGCLYAVAVPALALAYASGFAWLWSSGRRVGLSLLAPAGRMALTTYLSQTAIGIALFYGFGLNLRGRFGLIDGVALALVIFLMQCLAARVWLRWFRFGPIEWVWRVLTYGRSISLVRQSRQRPGRGGAPTIQARSRSPSQS
jgi:uncharacterized protein